MPQTAIRGQQRVTPPVAILRERLALGFNRGPKHPKVSHDLYALIFPIDGVLIAAWMMPRSIAIGATIVALGLTLALFIHHISDPLTLSF